MIGTTSQQAQSGRCSTRQRVVVADQAQPVGRTASVIVASPEFSIYPPSNGWVAASTAAPCRPRSAPGRGPITALGVTWGPRGEPLSPGFQAN